MGVVKTALWSSWLERAVAVGCRAHAQQQQQREDSSGSNNYSLWTHLIMDAKQSVTVTTMGMVQSALYTIFDDTRIHTRRSADHICFVCWCACGVLVVVCKTSEDKGPCLGVASRPSKDLSLATAPLFNK